MGSVCSVVSRTFSDGLFSNQFNRYTCTSYKTITLPERMDTGMADMPSPYPRVHSIYIYYIVAPSSTGPQGMGYTQQYIHNIIPWNNTIDMYIHVCQHIQKNIYNSATCPGSTRPADLPTSPAPLQGGRPSDLGATAEGTVLRSVGTGRPWTDGSGCGDTVRTLASRARRSSLAACLQS